MWCCNTFFAIQDENHVATAMDIVAYLEECAISAERRSIYRDIEEINRCGVDAG